MSTGAHNMKFGYQGSYQKSLQARVANQTQLQYRFNNAIPNAVSYYIAPRWEQNDRTESQSLFAQDSVDKRPPLAAGRRAIRPRVELGARRAQRDDGRRRGSIRSRSASRKPSALQATTTSRREWASPTMRLAMGRPRSSEPRAALQAATNDENYWANNPAMRTVTPRVQNARLGGDGNSNRVVDCDLLNPAAPEQPGGRRRRLRGRWAEVD